jgi:pimeloyl-ACP methyl ester carboxylesterase
MLDIPSDKVHVFGWSLGGHIAIDLFRKNPKIAKAILTGTPINDFEKTAAGFNALKNFPTQEPFPKGLTVFDLLSYDKPMTPEQAKAFHQLGGVPPSEMTKTAATATDPMARYYMIKFALEAHNQKGKLRSWDGCSWC